MLITRRQFFAAVGVVFTAAWRRVFPRPVVYARPPLTTDVVFRQSPLIVRMARVERQWAREMADVLMRPSPLFERLHKEHVAIDGGARIQSPLAYGEWSGFDDCAQASGA